METTPKEYREKYKSEFRMKSLYYQHDFSQLLSIKQFFQNLQGF